MMNYCTKKNILLDLETYTNCRDCQVKSPWSGEMCLSYFHIRCENGKMVEMVERYNKFALREQKLKRII